MNRTKFLVRQLIRKLVHSVPPKAETEGEEYMMEGLVELFMDGKISMRYDAANDDLMWGLVKDEQIQN